MQGKQQDPLLIQGGVHQDHRGQLTFFNDFDMAEVVRFYQIENKELSTQRAWRGHRIEKRWFYAVSGEFKIGLIKIDDWALPSASLKKEIINLRSVDHQVLFIPVGYATGVQALTEDAKLMVFADYGIDHAQLDNYLYDRDYFGEW
ncbi:WxcM-like domain-containing protein [Pedobacter frigiditerrae]|uniref:WxcM-like domain-containing protein n=1 Tax=Pedobacter frigiditerrae TaxID=2530452 RepID=UPI00292D67BC|nr:WxcM-like domain-containing protein [Pedobacter frigiditerrae]